MLLLRYNSKKDLKGSIGKRLNYSETSMFGDEYLETGVLYGARRPHLLGGKGREWFAQITMKDGLIVKVV